MSGGLPDRGDHRATEQTAISADGPEWWRRSHDPHSAWVMTMDNNLHDVVASHADAIGTCLNEAEFRLNEIEMKRDALRATVDLARGDGGIPRPTPMAY